MKYWKDKQEIKYSSGKNKDNTLDSKYGIKSMQKELTRISSYL